MLDQPAPTIDSEFTRSRSATFKPAPTDPGLVFTHGAAAVEAGHTNMGSAVTAGDAGHPTPTTSRARFQCPLGRAVT